MVIVQTMGGLGNQLFQYATGRRLALQHGVDLKLDVRSFRKDDLRDYILIHFDIKATLAETSEIYQVKLQGSDFGTRAKRVLQVLKPDHKKRVYAHSLWKEDYRILEAEPPIYLEGYWAHPRFFEDVRSVLLQEITLKPKYRTDGYRALLGKISSFKDPVAIHIRRGDYLQSQNQDLFGVLPLSYYQAAVKKIADARAEVTYIVFSDDPEWAKDQLKTDHSLVFAADYNCKDYQEFELMAKCKHQIIANSTFSWWAAWLNENPEKTVIAPKVWYKEQRAQSFYDQSAFIPSNWIKL